MNDRTVPLEAHLAETTAAPADDALGFDAFFLQEKERLFRAICLVTRNRYEAEELVQDAFVSVFERWDRVATMDDPTGYLYRTAMNAFRSVHRRSVLAAKRAIGVTRADDSISLIEDQDVVVRALAGLSHRQRAAVVLIDFLGFSSEEAGRMLGVRASTVRTHVARAHQDLRSRMEPSHE